MLFATGRGALLQKKNGRKLGNKSNSIVMQQFETGIILYAHY